jgi:hypothetical protein
MPLTAGVTVTVTDDADAAAAAEDGQVREA